jgi:oligopeptide/dipeptide ABC transporter ATP-binding protein
MAEPQVLITGGGRSSPAPLLSVRNLTVAVRSTGHEIPVVTDLSFDIARGECLGLVGESGSGKSMTCSAIIRLLPRNARVVEGSVWFDGVETATMPEAQFHRAYRGKRMALVAQDPLASLDPVFTVGSQVLEGVRTGFRGSRAAQRARAVDALRAVELPDAERRFRSYPHELSGGMRQRVMSAIAIASGAGLIIADEPTSALDVTVEASYLRLLANLTTSKKLALLFVTHNMRVVRRVCHRLAVMYAGRIVEIGPTDEILHAARHPYTQALLEAVPSLDERIDRLPAIGGQPPLPDELGPGCSFAPRCPRRFARCDEMPPPFETGRTSTARCWLLENGS